jgi:kynureninase
MDRVLRHREQFQVLGERCYLATACLGPFPRQGHDDAAEYMRARELHNRALGGWLERMDQLIGLVEQLLRAPQGSVAFRSSATACQTSVLSCIEPGPARNRIVVTDLDFHSSLHLYGAQVRRGFDIHTVRARDRARIETEDLVKSIDERTAIVAISHVGRTGALLDVAPVIARARAVGAIVILDAYQAVGVVPIDVATMDVDVLVGGTHKWLSGATGLAFLYVRPELANRLEPVYPGWFGHQDLGAYVRDHTFADGYRPIPGARRFQQGTPPVFPIYASRAGLRFVTEVGVEHLRARSLELTSQLLEGVGKLGIDPVTPTEPALRGGYICLRVRDPEAVVASLEQCGIDVDQRRREVVRVAPHPCCTAEDCERFIRALAEIADSSVI